MHPDARFRRDRPLWPGREGDARRRAVSAGHPSLAPEWEGRGQSATVNTAQGEAMPRKACVPSAISGAVASAAKAPEIRTARRAAGIGPRPADQIDGGADCREIQPVGGADSAPQHLAKMQRDAEGQGRNLPAAAPRRDAPFRLRAAATALSAASQALRGDPPTTGKIASTPSPMNFSTSPPKACTEPAMRSNQASSAEMTSDGGCFRRAP